MVKKLNIKEDYMDGEYYDQDSLSRRYRNLMKSGELDSLHSLFYQVGGDFDEFVIEAIQNGFSKLDIMAFGLCVEDMSIATLKNRFKMLHIDNYSESMRKPVIRRTNNESVEIEVKHEGVLEVPEGKNVDDLPIKHFVALANKKGLSKITKALNNLQVWNKNKDPKLSKWAGDMIDKVTKRIENKKNESYENIHSYDYTEKDTIANNIADWVFDGDIDSNLCELEDLIGPLDMEDYEAPETLADRLMTFDLDTLLYVESELNVQGIDESTHLEESNQDEIDYRLECADYAMYKVVTNHTGIELVSDNTNGKYEVTYNGLMVTVEFNLDGIAKYEYTINGEGPYCHDSYEYITNDIRDYIDEILDEEDDIDESCTLTEFSSNFDGTEFGEVEFYSKDLSDYPEYQIKSAIEAGCTFPINIYDVIYELGGNIVISYEVKEEDYNPDNIEQEIIAVLERLEDRIRG